MNVNEELAKIRASIPYRMAVWGLRVAPFALILLIVDASRLWPIAIGLTTLALILTMPYQLMAYFEWAVPRIEFDMMLLSDMINPRFR